MTGAVSSLFFFLQFPHDIETQISIQQPKDAVVAIATCDHFIEGLFSLGTRATVASGEGWFLNV